METGCSSSSPGGTSVYIYIYIYIYMYYMYNYIYIYIYIIMMMMIIIVIVAYTVIMCIHSILHRKNRREKCICICICICICMYICMYIYIYIKLSGLEVSPLKVSGGSPVHLRSKHQVLVGKTRWVKKKKENVCIYIYIYINTNFPVLSARFSNRLGLSLGVYQSGEK